MFTQPQIGKTTHNTLHFSSRFLEKFPTSRVILGSANERSAARFSRQIKRIVRHRLPIPKDVRPVDSVEFWETGYGNFGETGGLRSAGVGSMIGGYPAELIVVDDPIRSSKQVYSEVQRDTLWEWWDDVNQRAHNKTSYLFTMTRWHEDDLAGRILKTEGRVEDGGDWIVISVPAIAEENDILGRQVDEVVWPERFSFEHLDKIRKRRPTYFQSVYQQNPILLEGNIIKQTWWKWYKKEELPRLNYIILSLDSAWETKNENDYSVITAWGVRDDNIYLIGFWSDKVEVYDLKRVALNMYHKFSNFQQGVPVLTFLIEKKQSGIAVIQEFKRNTYLTIEEVIPTDSKEIRVHANTGIIESGFVWLPEDEDYTHDFVMELSGFPKLTHDDIVDSTMQALTYIKNNSLQSYRYLCE